MSRFLCFFLALLLLAPTSHAAPTRIAVASNFSAAMKTLAQAFQRSSGHAITPVFGSTGKHYAQIRHGAPFDALFAADVRRPQLLEQAGIGIAHSRFTYVIGRLALWSPTPGYVDPQGKILQSGRFRHLALANPKLAPYGVAAQQVMRTRKLYAALQPRLVFGENIAQTYQFVASGNVELGFVAWSQLKRPQKEPSGSWWLIPTTLHPTIEQQAILLSDNPVAADFVAFVKSPAGQQILQQYGYNLPGETGE